MSRPEPVAEVVLDSPVPHLDHGFDYAVPDELSDRARPGVRVRVRFAGRLVNGFVVGRKPASDFAGELQPVRLVSDERVLTPEILGLARDVARRWCGTLSDVLRLAVPPRHARAERAARKALDAARAAGTAAASADPETDDASGPATAAEPAAASDRPGPAASDQPGRDGAGVLAGTSWSAYPAAPSYWEHVAAGGAPRAVWTVLPGTDWAADLARAVRATRAAGRGVLVVVPSGQVVRHVADALTAVLPAGDLAVLTAEVGPEARYRRFLDVLHGTRGVVLGTRAAVFAPVTDLGLVVLWDDGDDLYQEPRAPYPTMREVTALRSSRAGAAWLCASFSRSVAAQRLVELGWAHELVAPRAAVRSHGPRVVSTADSVERARDVLAGAARLPHAAWRTARDALSRGPVLVQVPRAGYLPAVACEDCRARATCPVCHGPLTLPGAHDAPRCRWCGRRIPDWRCPECGSARLRALVVGAGRTADELGRAFPGTPVLRSAGDHVLADVPADPAIVVATPGAEPRVAGGYAAALLLDGWALLGLPTLRAGEETLRRWLRAAALVRPADAGGVVVVTADEPATVGALVRWDPVGYAARELAERRRLRLPPAVRMIALHGPAAAVDALLAGAGLSGVGSAGGDPAGPGTPSRAVEVLGAVPDPAPRPEAGPGTAGRPGVRTLVRLGYRDAQGVVDALRAQSRVRSAHRDEVVRVQVDPIDVI